MTNWYGYPYIALTGGADGALDSLDGSLVKDGDFAVVVVPGTKQSYIYTLDEDSSETEDGENVIAPDSNAGAKRWIRTNSAINTQSVMYYGAVGNGTTDDRAAIVAADAGVTGFIHFPPGSYNVASNLTITNPVKMDMGAKFVIPTGVTLTLNGVVDAALTQIFDLAGTGAVIFGAGTAPVVYPEWWGASVDNSAADNSAPLQACLDAVMDSTYGPEIALQAGTYSFDTRLNIDFAQGVKIRGVGGYWTPSDAGYGSVNVTILYYTGTDEAILIDGSVNNATGFIMEGVYVKGTANAAGGININNASGMKFRDMSVGKFSKAGAFGIKSTSSQLNIFEAVGLVGNRYGAWLSGALNVKNVFRDCAWHSNIAADFYDTGSFQTILYNPLFQNGLGNSVLISIATGAGVSEGCTLYNPYFEGGASTTDSYIIDVTGDDTAAASYYQHFAIYGGSYSGGGAHDLGFVRMRYTKRAVFDNIQFNTQLPSPIFTVPTTTNLFMMFYNLDPTIADTEFEDGSSNTVYWPKTFTNGRVSMVQRDTGDATELLQLRHYASNGTFMDFQGTEVANNNTNVSSWNNSAQSGHIKVEVNGTKKWLRVYDDPTS